MEFRALNAPKLTKEVVAKLETQFNNLPGIKTFAIDVEKQQFHVIFNEAQLSFNLLAQVMAEAGCPVQSINAALFKE